MPQTFNESFLGNANVPRSGGQDVTPANSPKTSGSDAGGTNSPRVTTQTIQAGINSTPSGKNSIPAGVQSFEDSL